MLPIIFDGLGNSFSIWQSDPIVRSISGLFVGIFLSIILVPFFKLTGIGKNKISVQMNSKKLFNISLVGLFLILLLYFPLNIYVFNILSYMSSIGLILITANIFVIWKFYQPEGKVDEICLNNGDENG